MISARDALAFPHFPWMHQTKIQLQQTAPSAYWPSECEIERVNPGGNDS